MSDERFIPGDVFHQSVRKVYDGPLDWAVNKEDAKMARVLYLAPHENAVVPPMSADGTLEPRVVATGFLADLHGREVYRTIVR